MASLVLTVAGYAVGGPIGALVGSFAGSFIDRKLFAPSAVTATQEGPRLTDLFVTSSSEGAPVPRVIGRMRVSPQMIWATNFREVVTVSTQTQTSGGKGGGGASSTVTTTTTTYSYFVSFALGLCEGPIVGIGGVWADGKPLDLSQYTFRLYKGDETQGPDPKIAAVEGAGRVPGFRGLAYLVFEEMPLEKFGNRIPQITVEVIRRPSATGARLEDGLKAVTVIPGLGEFIYATDTVYRSDGFGHSTPENRHGSYGKPDFLVALDQLQASAPNVNAVSLVVAWHGTDLRCGNSEIKPKVEFGASKVTTPWSWQVSGIGRAGADVVSFDSFGALLGGAPADRSVVQAIAELKARGLRVVLYPFVMMDIPPGNSLPNPYSDNAATIGQPAFPWRGRISCSPAPGYAGTVDKTSVAADQVAAFFGSAAPAHFGAWNGDTIPYSGPAEWSYRRFILHCAKLAVAAGGVDAFLIGSEMVALNRVRSSASSFPAVAHMVALAADVKAIVGAGCKVGYAADWSEYANFRPDDGSNDLYFHLDPLWASANIDFVGVDNYMPLSDWRSGRLHLDAQAGVPSIYDQAYLQSNIEGGELFDWFYASGEDRKAQVRTPVTDGAYGKPWVFRYKDFHSWWANQHYDRPGGVESATPTAWTPRSKPIWFTEFGCPAIDKGSNQPKVFYDPKSSESVFPYFSTGRRDDLIQRAFLEAHIAYWNPAAGHNPTSPVYDGPMIDPGSLFAWTWDARPYPQYPNASLVWRDAANWRRGHWLSGRLGLVTLADTVQEICSGLGVSIDTSGINGIVRGYTIDGIMSPRNALSSLMQVYFFDAVESGNAIRFVQRGGDPDERLERVVYGRFLEPEARKAFFEAYKNIEALWEILSPSPELRDHIEPYKRLAQLYAAVRNAYAEKVGFVADLAYKTKRLVEQSATQEGLGRLTKSVTFDVKTLEALRSEKGSDEGKVFNLVRGLQKEIDDDPNAAAVLQPLKDRAERILKDLDERKTTGLAAMDLLAALAAEKDAAAKAAKETEKLMARFPNARVNADEQRQFRAALYRPLLAVGREERTKIVDLIVEIATQ